MNLIELKCALCGTAFRRKKSSIEMRRRKRGVDTKFYCGHSCAHSAEPRRKRGPVKHYRLIRTGGKNVYEHRDIMEKHLGRNLGRFEQVHHKDENKSNNVIDNLVVLTPKQHAAEHARTTYDIDKAIRLYRRGWGFKRIAEHVGAYAGTDVFQALVRRGIHKPGSRSGRNQSNSDQEFISYAVYE